MKKRVITGLGIGIVYVSTILLSIYVHKAFFDIFCIFLAFTAGLEMCKAVSKKFGKPIDVFVIITIVIGYLVFYVVHHYIGTNTGGITGYFGVLALVFLSIIVVSMISKRFTISNGVSTMLVMIYPLAVLIYMLGINYLPDSVRVSGIILIFVISSFTDTFAYIVGCTVKGPKLCPRISPKKTISGAIGGLLGGMLGASIILLFSIFGILKVVPLSTVIGFNIMHFLLLGFGGSLFDQLGDLIASFIKRSCNIKDFGNLLPGHGGVLDRIDGMMINAIFVFIYLSILAF